MTKLEYNRLRDNVRKRPKDDTDAELNRLIAESAGRHYQVSGLTGYSGYVPDPEVRGKIDTLSAEIQELSVKVGYLAMLIETLVESSGGNAGGLTMISDRPFGGCSGS